MTARDVRANKKTRSTLKALFSLLSIVCLTVLVILRSDDAAKAVHSALSLCAKTVIPSLFPFMVISELIVSTEIPNFFGKLLSKPFRVLFGINGNGASAFLLGALCGFPIGTKCAVALCDKGELSSSELSRLICFCNNPSSAFVISAIGISLFGSRSFGTALFIITLISSATVGILMRFIFGSCITEAASSEGHFCVNNRPNPIHAFISAVTSSAEAMLTVCAFIIFFSALTGTLSAFLGSTGILSVLLTGALELTGGARAAALLGRNEAALVLCAAIVGWSGLSVHFQIMAICRYQSINMLPYFFAKGAQGAVNALLTLAYLRIIKPELNFSESAVSSIFLPIPQAFAYVAVALFIISVAYAIAKRSTKKGKKAHVNED